MRMHVKAAEEVEVVAGRMLLSKRRSLSWISKIHFSFRPPLA
jgi:hypothetical protein